MNTNNLAALLVQDDETLAHWWCLINHWKWPPELEEEEEDSWVILGWILNHIGLKACLKKWNEDRMTPEEFEDFWNSSHDPEAKARYHDYLRKQNEQRET